MQAASTALLPAAAVFAFQLLQNMSRRLVLPLPMGSEVVLTLKREPGGIVLEVADPVTQPLCKAPRSLGCCGRPGLLRRHEGR